MGNRDEVLAAFEILLEEIEAVAGGLHEAASDALNNGEYQAAKDLIQTAERVSTFRERVRALKSEWLSGMFQPTSSLPPTVRRPRSGTGASSRGLRTPLEAYRRPILEALDELGGAAPVEQVLQRVHDKVRPQLTEFDYKLLPGSGRVRWRNAAEWCRYNMVREGLLASGSPRGTWEITDAGKAELRRLRATDEKPH